MYIRTVTEIRAMETPWSELPEHIGRQFREKEKVAYKTGAIFFKGAAETLGEPTVISLFDRLDDDQPMWVYIESQNQGPSLVWFGFTFWNLVQQPQFRLASDLSPPITLPSRLDRIYRVFSGIRNGTYEGGLVPPEKMAPLSALTSTFREMTDIDATKYYGFYSFGNGDYFCINHLADCVFFNHERSTVDEVDVNTSLDSVLEAMSEEVDFGKALFGE